MKNINPITYALLIGSALATESMVDTSSQAITNDFFKYMGDFGSKLAFLSLEKEKHGKHHHEHSSPE